MAPVTLPEALEFLTAEVVPRAQLLDVQPDTIRQLLHLMGGVGLLGIRVPVEEGGAGWEPGAVRHFQEAVARASGALAFIQAQHQSACAFVADSANTTLRLRVLRRMAAGDLRCGVAFSHLRKSAADGIQARAEGGGYRLDGVAPWVTGWGIFDRCVAAATLPDGRSVWVLHRLADEERVQASPVMPLAAFAVSQTVSLTYRGLFVSKANVLYERPAGWIQARDQGAIAQQASFALGCAAAAIDILRTHAGSASDPVVSRIAEGLEIELRRRRLALSRAVDQPADLHAALRARVRMIAFMGRCAHAAVAASAGKANLAQHPAQRVWREALMFTVLSQTHPIRMATMAHLAGLPAAETWADPR